MILARRELEARTGPETGSEAGIVAEAIRRWLRPDEPDRLPDWGELSRALESPSIWKTAPVTAGMGAVIFAGMMLSREPAGPARERAARILSQAVAAKDVPGWLSWIAYYAWSRRDFLASEESPNSR
jgi:hypothetical protein